MSTRYMPDKGAFHAIFDQYAPIIHQYVGRFCPDPEDVDSVFGDIYLQLLEKFTLWKRPPSDPRLSLYRTAYDTLVKHLRARGQEPPSFINSLPSREEEQVIKEAYLAALNTSLA